ncbi:hypothetical protein E2C01_072406 [Portunus trituberculatus]|uniref:Uncharacterized protein n=1 Tax=Portunus trituberculatus TaxID=210409 RepID=A0A5B7I8V3_PORTR|nr:hypothetical protein [Portunus trituberculatus]
MEALAERKERKRLREEKRGPWESAGEQKTRQKGLKASEDYERSGTEAEASVERTDLVYGEGKGKVMRSVEYREEEYKNSQNKGKSVPSLLTEKEEGEEEEEEEENEKEKEEGSEESERRRCST